MRETPADLEDSPTLLEILSRLGPPAVAATGTTPPFAERASWPSRRHFLGGAAAALAGWSAGIGATAAHAATGGSLPISPKPSLLPPELRITGVLMEDYRAGDPIDDLVAPSACSFFLTARGQAGIVYPAKSATEGAPPNKVVCLLRDDGTVSGWSRSELTLPAGETLVAQQDGMPTFTLLAGEQTRLFLYGTRGLHACVVEPILRQISFTPWENDTSGNPIQRAPAAAVHPDTARYLVEHTLDLKAYYLRDLASGRTGIVYNNGQPLFFDSAAGVYRATLLRDSAGMTLRYVVAWTDRISLYALHPMDDGGPYGAGESVIVKAGADETLRDIVVLESADGTIEVFFSSDTRPMAGHPIRTTLKSCRTLDRNPSPAWSAPSPLPVALAGLPANTPCELVAAGFDPVSHVTNLLLHSGGGPVRGSPDRIWFFQRDGAGRLTTPAPIGAGKLQRIEPTSSFQVVRTEPVPESFPHERLRDLCWYTRDTGFSYRQILQPSSQAPTAVPWLRVGVGLMIGGTPAPNRPIQVRSAAPVFATLNGKLQFLTPDRPVATTTDFTGRLSIGIDVGTTMQGPDLYLSSDALGPGYEVVCHPADLVATGLSTLTAAQLAAARDPATGQPVLKDSGDAQAVMAIIGLVNLLVEGNRPTRTSVTGAPFTVTTDGTLGAETIRAGASASPSIAQAVRARAASRPAWRLARENGVLSYRPATPVQLSAMRAGASGGIRPMFGWGDIPGIGGVLGGVGDWFGGALNEVLGDGLDVVFHLVKDGVDIFLKYTLGPLSELPVLGMILDGIGIGAGTLLRLLTGLVFDWSAIERARDNWRALVRQNVVQAIRSFPDPAVSARGMSDSLRTAGVQVQAFCQSLKANPNERRGASGFTLPDFFPSSSLLESEPVRALLEKVLNALPTILSEPAGPAIAGLDAAIAKVGTGLGNIVTSLVPSLNDLANLIYAEIVGGQLLTAPLDPLLDLVGDRAQAGLAATATVVDDVAQVMSLIWRDPGKLVDWFDQTLNIPAVSSFYSSLTGGRLSLYDLFCLVCGLFHDPGVQGAPASAIRAMKAQGSSGSGQLINDWVTFTLASIQTATGGILAAQDTLHTSPTGFSTLEKLSMIADTLATLATATHVIVVNRDDELVFVAGATLLMVVGPVLLVRIPRASYERGPVGVAPTLMILNVLIWFFRKRNDLLDKPKTLAYMILLLLETLEMIGVRYYVQKKKQPITNPPLLAAILAAKISMSETRAILISN